MKFFIYTIFFLSILLNPLITLSDDDYIFKINDSSDKKFLNIFNKKNINSEILYNNAETLFNNKKFKKSAKAYEAYYKQYPNDSFAPLAVQKHAISLEINKKLNDAFDVYQFCLDNYSNQIDNYNEVLDSQYSIALQIMNKKRMALFGGGYSTPDLAIPYFEKIINNGPQWHMKPKALFLIGKCYFDVKKYDEAIEISRKFISLYPLNELAEESFWYQIQSLEILFKKYPESPEIQNRLLASSTIYLSDFPKSKRRNDVIKLRNSLYEIKANKIFKQGHFYEQVAKNNKAALISYKQLIKKFPKSKLASKAQDKIIYLESNENI